MAEKKSDEGEWRLAGESGESNAMDDWELVGGLASGEIRADAWVWKPGWRDWLRAREVEALRAAVPEAERAPVKAPRPQAVDADPPPVPRHADDDRHKTVQTPIPYTPSETTLPRISQKPDAPEGELFRSPVSTLVDSVEAELEQGNRTTLKPPGAVPPPPRGVPKPTPVRRPLDTPIPEREQKGDEQSEQAADTERDSAPPSSDTDDTIEESEPAPTTQRTNPKKESTRKDERGRPSKKSAHHEPRATVPRPLGQRPEHSLDATLPAASGFGERGKMPTTTRLLWVIAGLGVLCVGLMTVIVLLLFGRPKAFDAPHATGPASTRPLVAPPEPSASAVDPSPNPASPLQCELVKDARLIASEVALSVPVEVLALDTTSVAVGFAASRTHALGIRLSWPELGSEKVFEKQAGPALTGVVPFERSGQLEFVTDRVGGPLKSSRSLNVNPRVSVGAVAAGIAQWMRGRKPRVVWPGQGDQVITVPRTASSQGQGLAVTFRRGGRSGDIVLGWLSAQGDAASNPASIDKPGKLSGTPNVATNDERVLVTFANRDRKDAPWRVLAASAPLGEIPTRAEPPRGLNVPDGASVLSPVAAGLPNGGWLLQWTEEASGAYRVRLQVLNRELEAVGSPLEASPANENAGQGTVWAMGEHAISLFIVTGKSEKQLWARSVQCR